MPSLPTTSKRPPWVPAPVKREYQAHAERSPLYDTAQWRTMRRAALRAEPCCRTCAAAGRVTAATVLDHINPVRDGAAFFDAGNHAPLCRSCHARKSAKEGHHRTYSRRNGAQSEGVP